MEGGAAGEPEAIKLKSAHGSAHESKTTSGRSARYSVYRIVGMFLVRVDTDHRHSSKADRARRQLAYC